MGPSGALFWRIKALPMLTCGQPLGQRQFIAFISPNTMQSLFIYCISAASMVMQYAWWDLVYQCSFTFQKHFHPSFIWLDTVVKDTDLGSLMNKHSLSYAKRCWSINKNTVIALTKPPFIVYSMCWNTLKYCSSTTINNKRDNSSHFLFTFVILLIHIAIYKTKLKHNSKPFLWNTFCCLIHTLIPQYCLTGLALLYFRNCVAWPQSKEKEQRTINPVFSFSSLKEQNTQNKKVTSHPFVGFTTQFKLK